MNTPSDTKYAPVGQAQGATSSTSRDDRPWWLTEGIFFAGGWHPQHARVRRGIPGETCEVDCEWEYTPEHIDRLAELGVTLLIGQFDRGYAQVDQAESQRDAAKQAAMCHERGMHHACYMANTVYFESVLKESPDCEDWVVKTYDGRFVHYGGQQTFRWVACFNSPGWRKRMKQQIDIAIDDVKTDMLHFDNLAVWPEPDSCHCKYCSDGFRTFLKKRYPGDAEQKRRFGIASGNFETYRPPNFYMRFNPPWEVDRFSNPLLQEWIAFRQWTVTSYIIEMAGYARAKKPDILIESNGQGVWGCNQAIIHGIDTPAQSAPVDVFADENPDIRKDDSPDAIYPVTHKFRSMNYFRGAGKAPITAFRDEEALAFNIAFAGHPGINQKWGYSEPGKAPLGKPMPGVMALLQHYKNNRPLYLDGRSAARIAVWRNTQSLSLVSTDTHLSVCVMEQLLFDARIPFRIIDDNVVNSSEINTFDLVIVPNVEFIACQTLEHLEHYAKQGGAVLVTEKSGTFTSEPRKRKNWAFSKLFAQAGSHATASDTIETEAITMDPNAQFKLVQSTGQPLMANIGKGRAGYLPLIDYIHQPHAFESKYNCHYDGIDSRYWKWPRNHHEILETINWLAPSARPVRFAAGKELRTDLLKLHDGRLAIPLFRCGPINDAQPVSLPMVLCTKKEPLGGLLHLPQNTTPVVLKFSPHPQGYQTIIQGMKRLGVVTLDMQASDLR